MPLKGDRSTSPTTPVVAAAAGNGAKKFTSGSEIHELAKGWKAAIARAKDPATK